MDNARRYIHAESSSSACNRVDSVDTRSKRTQLIEPISHIYIYIYISEASSFGCEKRRLALQPRGKGIC